MKKAQILSALALAFALGVVAPVASVVTSTSVSAYNTEKDTATYADTVNAIAFVENDATYKAYVQIQDALKDFVAGKANGTIADFADADNDNIVDVAGEVSAKIAAATSAGFGYNATKIGNDITAEKNFAKQVSIAIAAAQSSELYNKLADVIDLLTNSTDNSANNAKLVSAVTALRKYTLDNNIVSGSAWNDLHPEKATINSYKNSNPITTVLNDQYSEATDIFDAVEAANEALAKYNKGYNMFMPLLTNSGLLSQAAQDAIANNVNITLNDLETYARNSINRNAQWQALYEEVQNVKANRVSEESGDNYQLIRDLALDWQAASGNEQAVETVMARMVAYKAPTTGEGTNNGDNTNNGNKAPNTGILADAEGNASTTVAMVAGIATALTAAGAGVVAYRNARRSTRK